MTPQPPPWLDRNEYPFRSRAHRTSEGTLHYIDEGKGHPVVMVHGNPTWSFAYRKVVRGLAPHARAIALDHLGFGLSDKPRTADYSPQAQARRFEGFVEALGLPKVTLMVQDWGGPIGLSYALAHPERIHSLVLLNTWLWSVRGDPHFERFSALLGGPLGRFAITRFNVFVTTIMKRAVADPRTSLPPAVHRHYAEALPDPTARLACAALPGHILGSSDWLAGLWRERDRLAKVPVLVLWGDRDIAFRQQELQTWRHAFPAAEVHTFEDAGHYVQEEKGEEVARLTADWLRRTKA